jgi:hypothetical protein
LTRSGNKKTHFQLFIQKSFSAAVCFAANQVIKMLSNASSQISIVTQSEVLAADVSQDGTSNENNLNESLSPDVVYKSYPERWTLLMTVTLINVANCAHWISFGSVNSKAAIFYDKRVEEITKILTISYGLGIPFCLVATYVVSRFGLRIGVFVGGILTFVGGLLCCLATLPGRTIMFMIIWTVSLLCCITLLYSTLFEICIDSTSGGELLEIRLLDKK